MNDISLVFPLILFLHSILFHSFLSHFFTLYSVPFFFFNPILSMPSYPILYILSYAILSYSLHSILWHPIELHSIPSLPSYPNLSILPYAIPFCSRYLIILYPIIWVLCSFCCHNRGWGIAVFIDSLPEWKTTCPANTKKFIDDRTVQ